MSQTSFWKGSRFYFLFWVLPFSPLMCGTFVCFSFQPFQFFLFLVFLFIILLLQRPSYTSCHGDSKCTLSGYSFR